MKDLVIGLKNTCTETVVPDNTAASMASGTLPVYATPAMILLMEKTAALCVADCLDIGASTVGTLLNVKHLSASPVGMNIRCECELIEIDRKRLVFKVEAYDDAGMIGEGTHERFIIDAERFMTKAEAKLAK